MTPSAWLSLSFTITCTWQYVFYSQIYYDVIKIFCFLLENFRGILNSRRRVLSLISTRIFKCMCVCVYVCYVWGCVRKWIISDIVPRKPPPPAPELANTFKQPTCLCLSSGWVKSVPIYTDIPT